MRYVRYVGYDTGWNEDSEGSRISDRSYLTYPTYLTYPSYPTYLSQYPIVNRCLMCAGFSSSSTSAIA